MQPTQLKRTSSASVRPYWLWVLLCSLMLSACQSPGVKEDIPEVNAGETTTADISDLLARAEQSPPDIQLALMIDAAEQLLRQDELAWARNVIQTLPPVYMMYPEYERQILKARVAWLNSTIESRSGNDIGAFELVNTSELMDSLYQLPPDLAFSIVDQRAELLVRLDNVISAIQERARLSESVLLDINSSQANNQSIWLSLMALPIDTLETQEALSDSATLIGWYSLALLSKVNQNNLTVHVEQVEQWLLAWPNHPATLDIPADLQLLRELADNQPEKVALLLPTSGKYETASQSIINGFMAGYYRSQNQNIAVPKLVFYDTLNQDISELYDLAVSEGADMVIGPLTKNNISELALRPELPVPTFALNHIDLLLGTVANLYQFGLGVEDEAEQNAEKMQRDGHRFIVALAPNSLWGDRSVKTYTNTLNENIEVDVDEYRFEDASEYSNVIKRTMHIDRSENRAKELRRMIGKLEFEPRRRQDIDAIFLSANSAQARQIKPILAFHFAGDIPIYATGSVFEGAPNPTRDSDLNGIYFTVMPWFFDSPDTAVQNDLQQGVSYNARLSSFYALGLDCFYLYTRLPQLAQVQQAQFYGQSGRLQMDNQGRIHRRQLWAQFRKGKPELVSDIR